MPKCSYVWRWKALRSRILVPFLARRNVELLAKVPRGSSRFEPLPFAGPGRHRVRDLLVFLNPLAHFGQMFNDFARFLGPSDDRAQRRAAEFEMTQNLGDFWMALLHIRQGGARYRTVFFSGENKEFEFDDC